jgi:phosphoglucosamine mutase
VALLRFGTDGIRAEADTELTSAISVKIGSSIGRALSVPEVVLAWDTRESSPRIGWAIASGLSEAGVRVRVIGVLPTPGASYLAGALGVPAVVVSASHNPYRFNGVKVFEADGRKADPETEARIEELLSASDPPRGASAAIVLEEELSESYVKALVERAGKEVGSLRGLRVVLDCANGAASEVAPRAFEELGAKVECMAASPDGRNINEDCGALFPEALARRVIETGADLGLAFDGDADRVIAVDERGHVRDGDYLIAILACHLDSQGRLKGRRVVATVMSNLGLAEALASRGIGLVRTGVGDREVFKALVAEDLVLGGEQSGHLIIRHLAQTGDGILTGLVVAGLVAGSGRLFSAICESLMTRYPQVLLSVPMPEDDSLVTLAREEAARLEAASDGRLRALVRKSGTEPLVRVMVEAATEQEAQSVAERLTAVLGNAK